MSIGIYIIKGLDSLGQKIDDGYLSLIYEESNISQLLHEALYYFNSIFIFTLSFI